MTIQFIKSNACKIELEEKQYDEISSLQRIQQGLTKKDVIGLDIYDDEKLVGFAMLRNYDEKKWFLWNYAIDKAYQNQHYGQMALLELMDFMKNNYGAKEVTTTYIWGNSHAKYIYEKVGFIETDIVDEPGCHEVNMVFISK